MVPMVFHGQRVLGTDRSSSVLELFLRLLDGLLTHQEQFGMIGVIGVIGVIASVNEDATILRRPGKCAHSVSRHEDADESNEHGTHFLMKGNVNRLSEDA
jgi:hypothetical protein